MNIYTVRDNLLKTIAGKEQYLANLEIPMIPVPERMAKTALAEFLKININELKVILFDVEKCCEQYSLMSWEINPERMGQ